MRDMGYFLICFECDPVLVTIDCSGAGIVNSRVEKEEVNEQPGIKYFKVALDSNDYSIKI